MSKGFTCVHIGQMHFDKWNCYARERITNRHTGVRECRWINDDGLVLPARTDTTSVEEPMIGRPPTAVER